MKSGRVLVGHPVDVASGVEFTAAHDEEVWGVVPLVFRRSYSTARLEAPDGVLGRGWEHDFAMSLTRDLEGYRYRGHGGVEVPFDLPRDGELDETPIVRPGDFMSLRRRGDRFEVLHWHGLGEDPKRFVFVGHGDALRLDRVESPAGHALVIDYDAHGRVVAVTQSLEGRRFVLEHRGDRLSSLALQAPGSSAAVVATYHYDRDGMLAAVEDATGAAVRYVYDRAGRLVEETTRAGLTTRMRYDDRGRCVESVSDGGLGRRRFHFFDGGRVTEVVDGEGRSTLYEYNEQGQVERETRPDGAVLVTRLDELGRVVEEIDARKAVTAYRYDDRGDLVATVHPGGATREVAWDDDHQPVEIREGDSVWRMTYHRGALVEVVDPEGAVRRYTRDARNDVVGVTHPNGYAVWIEHDREWRVERVGDAAGLLSGRVLDARLNAVEEFDAVGVLSRSTRDALGRIVAHGRSDGGGYRVQWHDAERGLTVTDARGHTQRVEHDAAGRCVATVDGNGLTSRYEWDAEDRIVAAINAAGERATFAYDVGGRLVEATRFDGVTERWEHDLGGLRTRALRADGTALAYEYDLRGCLTRITEGDAERYVAAYDDWGRVVRCATPDAEVTFRYDRCGRIVQEVQNGVAVDFTYDQAGNVCRRAWEGSVAGPLRLGYDPRGRLKSLGCDERSLQTFAYDGRDNVVMRRLGAVDESLEFDRDGRLRVQRVVGHVERRYGYDEAGDELATIDSLRGTSRWHHDAADRLVAEESPRGSRRYHLDARGDCVRVGDVEATFGPGSRLLRQGLSRFEHDALGRRSARHAPDGVTRYEWNTLDQLVAVHHPDGTATRFGYDGLGRRVFKDHAGQRREYLWAGDDLMAERGGGRTVEYAIDRFWPHAMWVDGEVHHFVNANRGVPHEAFDAEGRMSWRGAYDAWGELVASSGDVPVPLRLPGQYADPETGLRYNRHRYFDDETRRFVSPDPIGILGGFNAYRFAPSPVRWEDPYGLACTKSTSGWSVYVLEKKGPPPVVVYVGITTDPPHVRLSGHRNEKPAGSFDQMRVVATGLTNRRDARNIEGSALFHIAAANSPTNPVPLAVPLGPMLNAPRQDGGYWHGYRDNNDTQRPLMTNSATAQALNGSHANAPSTPVVLPR